MYISQVSGECLQDHWSSGFLYGLVRDVVFTFLHKLIFSVKRIDVLEIFQCHKIVVDTLNRHLQNHNLKANSVSVVNNNDNLKTIG